MTPPADLVEVVRGTAARHGLDPLMVAAIVQQESAWQPWAIRYEPGYRWLWPSADNPYQPKGVSKDTEAIQQKTSWGLMQVMGAVAREHGYRLPFLGGLLQPAMGLEFGCLHLSWLRRRFPKLEDLVSAYNAGRPRLGPGGNLDHYVGPVLQHMADLAPVFQEDE